MRHGKDLEGGGRCRQFHRDGSLKKRVSPAKNGDNVAQIADRFQEIADPGFVAGKAFAVVLSILLFVPVGPVLLVRFAAHVAARCVADAANASGRPERSSKEFSGFSSSHLGLLQSSWSRRPCLVPPTSIMASLARPARPPS